MAKKQITYKRLPGRGRTLSHYISLYRGPDHLLQVASTGYSESYKRFFYRDIQTVILARTIRGKVWNVIWIALALLFGLPALYQSGESAIILWGIAFFCLLCLAINAALGPTCICQFGTAVQQERMPSLQRLWKAQRVLAILRPLIASAQGELSREELQLKWATEGAAAPGTGVPSTTSQDQPNAPPVAY